MTKNQKEPESKARMPVPVRKITESIKGEKTIFFGFGRGVFVRELSPEEANQYFGADIYFKPHKIKVHK